MDIIIQLFIYVLTNTPEIPYDKIHGMEYTSVNQATSVEICIKHGAC